VGDLAWRLALVGHRYHHQPLLARRAGKQHGEAAVAGDQTDAFHVGSIGQLIADRSGGEEGLWSAATWRRFFGVRRLGAALGWGGGLGENVFALPPPIPPQSGGKPPHSKAPRRLSARRRVRSAR